jgi:hypothetical protein
MMLRDCAAPMMALAALWRWRHAAEHAYGPIALACHPATLDRQRHHAGQPAGLSMPCEAPGAYANLIPQHFL